MVVKTFSVVGMSCAVCAGHIEKKLTELEGVASVSVSLAGNSVTIGYDSEFITPSDMKVALASIGYELLIDDKKSSKELKRRSSYVLWKKVVVAWLLSVLVMSLAMGWVTVGDEQFTNQIQLIVATGAIVFCGGGFYRNAFKQLRHGTAGMDALVALSTMISYVFSVFNTFWGDEYWSRYGMENHTYFDASVMIITFVLTGRLLEERAKDSTASAIRELMGLMPNTAHLITQEGVSDIPVASLRRYDRIEVRSGEKIPVDGTLTEGEAYVDESMISGEPLPARKEEGSQAYAGTIVVKGTLRMRAKNVGAETTLSHIIEMVRIAQSSKAPVQHVVDRIAMIFVPTVLCLAVVTLLSWLVAGGMGMLPRAILSATSVIVIACPCAMGLATPTAIMVGIGKAAKRNILIKDATALEMLCKVDAMVVDKTGTLTIPNKDVDFTSTEGLSYECREELKPNVSKAVSELRKNGVEVYMMSGDRADAAKYWAEKSGIEHYFSEALPQDKENLVRKLQSEGKVVAMVGDGINDSQALAAADVSVAMGKGTDIAMDIAQVTLVGEDLMRIPDAIHLSHKTVNMIHQNLFWAFAYNVVCIPLAAGVPCLFGIDFQITPMLASALMACSSLSVVLNSLRLKMC